MPVAYIDIPAGVNDGAKKKIFQEMYEAIHQAWPIPDTRVLIREWPNEAVSQDGRIENMPMRPICTLAVPPGLGHDGKQRLVRQISNTLGDACGRKVEEIRLPSGTTIYNNWVLTFFWELPLDRVALGDLIATENPLVLENLPPQLRSWSLTEDDGILASSRAERLVALRGLRPGDERCAGAGTSGPFRMKVCVNGPA